MQSDKDLCAIVIVFHCLGLDFAYKEVFFFFNKSRVLLYTGIVGRIDLMQIWRLLISIN